MFGAYVIGFAFLVCLGLLIDASRREQIGATAATTLMVVVLVICFGRVVERHSQGLVPAEPASVADQLAGDTIFCVLWSMTSDAEDHLATVVNMMDGEKEVRTVRTIEVLPDKKCFALIRGVPTEVTPPQRK